MKYLKVRVQKTVSTTRIDIGKFINLLYRRVGVWWRLVHSTRSRSFFGTEQQSLLHIMTQTARKTAPTLANNMIWSVSCLAGGQPVMYRFLDALASLRVTSSVSKI